MFEIASNRPYDKKKQEFTVKTYPKMIPNYLNLHKTEQKLKGASNF